MSEQKHKLDLERILLIRMHLRFQHQIFLIFSPENLNVMHFSHLADCPRRAVVWSSFGSEWLPKFHTYPLNHIFSGLELTSLISWKSAISDIISLSSWSAPRKVPAGRFRPPRLLQSEATAPFTEQKPVCSWECSSFLMAGCRKNSRFVLLKAETCHQCVDSPLFVKHQSAAHR